MFRLPLSSVISRLILSAIIFITIFAYFTSYYGWSIYLEIFSHFQVQYFILTCILLGLLIFMRCKSQIYLGIFCCAILSAQIFPWLMSANNLFTAIQESDLRVLVINVNTHNKNYGKVIDLVQTKQPDIAIFMEVNQEWQTHLDTLIEILPYSSGHCNSCNLGILLYTNEKLNSSQIEFFGADHNSSIVAELTIADQPLTIVGTHPLPPLKPTFFQSRNQQINSISQYLAQINHRIILAGDFNMSMWSPYSRQLITTTGLHDTRKGFGIFPSWPTMGTYSYLPHWLTFLGRIPIDRCLISRGLQTINLHTGQEIGSDHLPLIVDLKLVER